MRWPHQFLDLEENLDMRFSFSLMRTRKFFGRHIGRMIFACALMAAFQLGRATASGLWWNFIPLIPWVVTTAWWTVQLRRHLKCEQDELNQVISQTREEILRRRFGGQE